MNKLISIRYAVSAVALFLILSARLAAEEPGGRHPLEVDTTTLRLIGGPKNIAMTPLEGGGVRITYDNSDFASKGEYIIQMKIDPPEPMSRAGFEMKMASSERPTATCTYEGEKGLECRLEGQGAVLSEYVVDFADAAAAKGVEMKPVTALNIRVGIVEEAGQQTVELKNWWFE